VTTIPLIKKLIYIPLWTQLINPLSERIFLHQRQNVKAKVVRYKIYKMSFLQSKKELNNKDLLSSILTRLFDICSEH
jgi:hypothetical protein